jgi:hypothetical protein
MSLKVVVVPYSLTIRYLSRYSSLHGCREGYPRLGNRTSQGIPATATLQYYTSTTTFIAIIARASHAPDISPTSLLSSRLIVLLPSAAYDRARITVCVSLPRPRLEALCITSTAPNNNVFPL